MDKGFDFSKLFLEVNNKEMPSVLRIVGYQMGGTARFELDSIENPNFVEVSIVGMEGVAGALINRRQIKELREWLYDADTYLEQGKLPDPEQPS